VRILLLFVAVVGSATAQLLPEPDYHRANQAHKYADGFVGVDCFAGQVKVRGKKFSRQPFSLFAPNEQKKCCGSIVQNSHTDQHGHFLIEPLAEGEYFVKFGSGASEYISGFAVLQSYEKCMSSSFLEINYLQPRKPTIQESILVDGGEECQGAEPYCYRK